MKEGKRRDDGTNGTKGTDGTDEINDALRVSTHRYIQTFDVYTQTDVQMAKWVELGRQWLFESLKLPPFCTFLQASSGLANPLPFRSCSILVYFSDTGYFKSIVSLGYFFCSKLKIFTNFSLLFFVIYNS